MAPPKSKKFPVYTSDGRKVNSTTPAPKSALKKDVVVLKNKTPPIQTVKAKSKFACPKVPSETKAAKEPKNPIPSKPPITKKRKAKLNYRLVSKIPVYIGNRNYGLVLPRTSKSKTELEVKNTELAQELKKLQEEFSIKEAQSAKAADEHCCAIKDMQSSLDALTSERNALKKRVKEAEEQIAQNKQNVKETEVDLQNLLAKEKKEEWTQVVEGNEVVLFQFEEIKESIHQINNKELTETVHVEGEEEKNGASPETQVVDQNENVQELKSKVIMLEAELLFYKEGFHASSANLIKGDNLVELKNKQEYVVRYQKALAQKEFKLEEQSHDVISLKEALRQLEIKLNFFEQGSQYRLLDHVKEMLSAERKKVSKVTIRPKKNIKPKMTVLKNTIKSQKIKIRTLLRTVKQSDDTIRFLKSPENALNFETTENLAGNCEETQNAHNEPIPPPVGNVDVETQTDTIVVKKPVAPKTEECRKSVGTSVQLESQMIRPPKLVEPKTDLELAVELNAFDMDKSHQSFVNMFQESSFLANTTNTTLIADGDREEKAEIIIGRSRGLIKNLLNHIGHMSNVSAKFIQEDDV